MLETDNQVRKNEPKRGQRALMIGLGLVTVAALPLRLAHLGAESLWMDELHQVSYYPLPLDRVVAGASNQAQAPLDYLIGAGLARLGLANSDWWVRFPAACFGTGCVFLLGLWIGRIAGTAAGLGAAVLLAVCPLHVAMSQEARPYTIFFFLTLATVLLFVHARQRHTFITWLNFGLCLLALLLTRWVGPHFIFLGLVAYSLATWMASRRGTDSTQRRLETHKQWAAGTAMITAYAVYNPVGLLIFLRMGRQCVGDSGIDWTTRFTGMLSDSYAALLNGYSARTLSAASGPSWLLVAVAVLAAVGIVRLFRIMWRTREPVAILFATTVLVFPALYSVLYATTSSLPPKPQYLLLMAVPLVGSVAIAADALRLSTLRLGRVGSGLVFFAVIGTVAVPMTRASVRSLQTPEKRDWRGVLTFLRARSATDDAFAVVAPHCVPQRCTAPIYGVPRYGRPGVEFLAMELNRSLDPLDAPHWSRTDNTVWIVGLTDVYEAAPRVGYGLLPPPEAKPPDFLVHHFTNLFVLELRGDMPAVARLLAGIDRLTASLPDGHGFVGPNLYAGRYCLTQGDPSRADAYFEAARRQCRSDADRDALIRDYLP